MEKQISLQYQNSFFGEKWKKMKVNLLGRTPEQVVEDLNYCEDVLFCRNLKHVWRISPIIDTSS